MLHFSYSYDMEYLVDAITEGTSELDAFYEYLIDMHLDPKSIVQRKYPTSFVDFVYSARSFSALFFILMMLSNKQGLFKNISFPISFW